MTTIYLVRHGITQANKENRFAGRTEEELHPEGTAQIHHVGEKLIGDNISGIYCGPATRTVQSSQILASLLNVPFTRLDELHEINIPHWDGLTKEEIRQKYEGQYPTWLNSPNTFKLPGCETLEQVQNRAVACLTSLLARHKQGKLLVVSHLVVLRCLVLYFQRMAIKDFRSVKIENGEIIRVSEMGNDRYSIKSL
jgi:broad specificity phosphatase PhoE